MLNPLTNTNSAPSNSNASESTGESGSSTSPSNSGRDPPLAINEELYLSTLRRTNAEHEDSSDPNSGNPIIERDGDQEFDSFSRSVVGANPVENLESNDDDVNISNSNLFPSPGLINLH